MQKKGWARGAPNILGFSFNIFTMAKDSDIKFSTQFGFAKAHHKTTPRGKVGVALDQGSSNMFGVPLQYFCYGRAVLLALSELLVAIPYCCWCCIAFRLMHIMFLV